MGAQFQRCEKWRSGTLLIVAGVLPLLGVWNCTVDFSDGPRCGNGLFDPGEACDDGNETSGDGCSSDCILEDGWVCESQPSSCHAICGDDRAVGDEACDGADLGGATCESLGLGGGRLVCSSDCSRLDASRCEGSVCGDGLISGDEACDGTNLDGADCLDFGYRAGELRCQADCASLDFSGCLMDVCGDGVATGEEACDGPDLRDKTCASLGYDGGTLSCLDDCSGYDLSACVGGSTCGNGVVESGEDCDPGQGDTPECDANCTFASCGDRYVNQAAQEVCDDGPDAQLDGCWSCEPSEFQVSTSPAEWWGAPQVAMAGAGRFVVVWAGVDPSNGTDDIFARVYGPDGAPLTGQFLVNTTRVGEQQEPRVSMSDNGDFVVVWQTDPDDQYQENWRVATRGFDSQGSPLTDEVFVDPDATFRYQASPSVAFLSEDTFVVVWTADDADPPGLHGRALSLSGTYLGMPFEVNEATHNDQVESSVSAAPDGSFVVAWTTRINSYDSTLSGRRFQSPGEPLGGDFDIETDMLNSPRYPRVAVRDDGSFVVAWIYYPRDTDLDAGVMVRLYGSDGEALGPGFRVNPDGETAGGVDKPGLIVGPNGAYLVTWTPLIDGEVWFRGYVNDTSLIGPVRANISFSNGDSPDVAGASDGGFVLVWNATLSNDDDHHIYAKRYDADGQPLPVQTEP